MVTFRRYQEEALRELFAFWRSGGGNPLIVMATGLGKSVVIAFLIKQLLIDHPKMRVLITAPNRELMDQDIKELLAIWPDAPIGINCDGLGQRDTDAQILFALVNSIYRDPKAIGARDLIIIDEAHFIPHHEQGMYRATIEALRGLVPDLRVGGLTATPFRLDSGHLCEGEGHIFDSIVYEYGIAEGIRDDWLSPLSSKATHSTIDVSGVGKRGGEFIAEQLEAAALQGDIVVCACNELAGYKGCRRAWLVYCVGIKHAELVRDELRARGIDCEMVLGETPGEERDRTIEDFRAGRLTALVSVNVLSYGFNVPHVDLIAMLRPTCSTGLYVQQVGRGTRKVDGKKDCLVLDFAGNVRRHGPVDIAEANIDDRERKKDEAPVKTCPVCREIVMLAVKECPCCGHAFPSKEISHNAIADTVEILASQRKRSEWLEVEDVYYFYHAKETPSLRVSYQCGFETYRKWVCLEHQGWAKLFADKWWRQMTGGEQPPKTVDEALKRQDELLPVTHIQVAPSGKYWEIVAYRIELENGDTYELDRHLNRPDRMLPKSKPPINDSIQF
jgi:DNA repair protein RadD